MTLSTIYLGNNGAVAQEDHAGFLVSTVPMLLFIFLKSMMVMVIVFHFLFHYPFIAPIYCSSFSFRFHCIFAIYNLIDYLMPGLCPDTQSKALLPFDLRLLSLRRRNFGRTSTAKEVLLKLRVRFREFRK